MELINDDELKLIAKQCGFSKVSSWIMEEYPDKVIGYLGDHLKLILEVESEKGYKSVLNLFVKCMPRLDKWKSDYLKEAGFFKKEYVMLSTLFKEFKNEGSQKWRPKSLFVKENIFVFENVSLLEYKMPHHQDVMTYEEIKASVQTLARFHAQSYIHEETKSKELGRPYRIWEQYSEYLQEPERGKDWRDTGRNAIIAYLKVYSKHKSKPNFNNCIDSIVPILFNRAIDLMKPSSAYRNVVVHRDLWTNNIFLKKLNSGFHALFVDYQTVLYCSPMLDLSSLIYFNTTRSDRDNCTNIFIEIYFEVLSKELQADGINIEYVIDRSALTQAYHESILFGLTQAALITPIVAMSKDKREQIFYDPESSKRANVVTRSKEFIEIAKEDSRYQTRITELLDEIVERYIFPEETDRVHHVT